MGPLGEVETTMATSAQSLARPRPAWQLTKRALVGGDTEKVALEWANEQVWAGCTGQIAGQERSRFPQYWHSPQVRAGVPLTRSAESSLPDRMAPQTGLERMTFWLTAERRRRSHRCEPTSKKARHGRSRAGEWGLPDAIG